MSLGQAEHRPQASGFGFNTLQSNILTTYIINPCPVEGKGPRSANLSTEKALMTSLFHKPWHKFTTLLHSTRSYLRKPMLCKSAVSIALI